MTATGTSVEKMLRNIGVPAHIKGHQYLLCAVELAAKKQINSDNIAKEIYAPIAERFQTTPERVCRAIEHAIMVCWNRNDSEALQGYFGDAVSQMPTNAECISLLSEKL